MALDAHELAAHQAGAIGPWLADAGQTCDTWVAADHRRRVTDRGRTWDLSPGHMLFICRRGEAEIWLQGVLLPSFGNGGQVVERVYVLEHLHLRRGFSGRSRVQSFQDARLRKAVRVVLNDNARSAAD